MYDYEIYYNKPSRSVWLVPSQHWNGTYELHCCLKYLQNGFQRNTRKTYLIRPI